MSAIDRSLLIDSVLIDGFQLKMVISLPVIDCISIAIDQFNSSWVSIELLINN